MIYYVDNKGNGNGCSTESPINDYRKIPAVAGDSILFRCGNLYRDVIDTIEGVTYGSWGDGEKPTFCGSLDASSKSDWIEVEKNLWLYNGTTEGKVGNIVLDGGYGTFRWEKSDLCRQGDFWDNRQTDENKPQEYDSEKLLLWSKGNPADRYSSIEICHYGKRVLGYIKSNTAFIGLKFMNCGIHGLAGQGKNVVIKNCDFKNIGGGMFYKNKRVRFGNAIEFWQYGEDILIEECTFNQVYDSCITHQGEHKTVTPAVNMVCRNNRFENYGMAAFEYRDRLPINSSFENNVCLGAGCGFAMQGEELPRYSEIYPQPMGHHIFMWRIENGSDGGSLTIKGNTFGPSPVGAAIYSIISKEAEEQVTFCNNTYTDPRPIMWGGEWCEARDN